MNPSSETRFCLVLNRYGMPIINVYILTILDHCRVAQYLCDSSYT